MKTTPNEIRTKEFARSIRGYDCAEVRKFLEDIASEFENIQALNAKLGERIIGLETSLKNYTEVEKALQQTFMQAQETTGKAIETARKEAQLIVREAEVTASRTTEKARNDLGSLKEQITILQARKDAIISRLKMLLTSELDLIKTLEVNEETTPRESPDPSADTGRDKLEIEEIVKNLESM